MEKNQLDRETTALLRNTFSLISETERELLNEPSIGLYYIQQNIRKVVPANVTIKRALKTVHANVVDRDLLVDDCLFTSQSILDNASFGTSLEYAQIALALITELNYNKAGKSSKAKIKVPSSLLNVCEQTKKEAKDESEKEQTSTSKDSNDVQSSTTAISEITTDALSDIKNDVAINSITTDNINTVDDDDELKPKVF